MAKMDIFGGPERHNLLGGLFLSPAEKRRYKQDHMVYLYFARVREMARKGII